MNAPRIKLEPFNISAHTYQWDNKCYRVEDIIELSKSLESFDLPIAGIDLSRCPWGEVNLKSFAHHYIRVEEADLKYPIILDVEGFICDGWHRLCKAIVTNKKTIKAVRLEIMPEPVVDK